MAIKGHANVVTRVGNFFKKRGGEAVVFGFFSLVGSLGFEQRGEERRKFWRFILGW